MRGKDEQQLDVFSYLSPEQRVPQDHPLRSLRAMTDEALRDLQPWFHKLYARTGRPSIAPEKLLRALLLQALYSVRSERLLMEQLDYNLLFRWFVGLNMDDSVWDATVFTKNRERLLDGDIAEAFFQAVLQQARERSLLSDEHFTVDGTLLEAWASVKSYQRKDAKNVVPPDDPGNATVDFHGEKRSNQTHASKTDPDAKMARKGKGKEAKLTYNGNLLGENRNGLIVNTEVFEANGTAERDAALVMLEQIPGTKQVTVSHFWATATLVKDVLTPIDCECRPESWSMTIGFLPPQISVEICGEGQANFLVACRVRRRNGQPITSFSHQ